MGVEASHLPELPSISAVGSPAPMGAIAVSGGGAAEAIGERVPDLTVVEGAARSDRRGLLWASWWQLLGKRSLDVAGSLVLLLLLLPVLLVTAAAIKVSSRGPVLYVHKRIGRGGKPFRMLKFRSMRVQAHEDREDILHLNQAAGPVFKIREDPRITKVGHLIRKLSIDELPQLVNVLLGDMSLVGPRPPLPEEYATYGARERRRMAVTPGLTCIWQVSGRSDVDFDTWVEMDLDYIESWNLRRDLKILLATVPAVVSGRGAY
jgi:lipopolysaccharide/colanic/teichoic acid biosynthesis glycosyltransferase